MSKLLQWGFGEISKFNGILFYPKVLLSIQFLPVLTGLGGDCPDQFLLHILPSCPLHLCIHIPISLPHNISPHRSLFISFSLFRIIFVLLIHPSLLLFLYFSHIIFVLLVNLYLLLLAVSHHLHHPCETLYLFIPLNIPQPLCLSQRFVVTRVTAYTCKLPQ